VQRKLPFYVLGSVVTDIVPGYEKPSIPGAIARAWRLANGNGRMLLANVTPKGTTGPAQPKTCGEA